MLNRKVKLKQVGYWRESGLAGLLDQRARPEDCVDESWSRDERAAVLEYLHSRGRVHDLWMGYSQCRICGVENGCHDMTDGTYVWPSGYVHYIEQHGVKPPEHFIAHVVGRSR